MMNTKEIKRLVILNIPYVIRGFWLRISGKRGDWRRGRTSRKDPCTVWNDSGGIWESAPEYASGRSVRGICMRSRTEDCGLSPR